MSFVSETIKKDFFAKLAIFLFLFFTFLWLIAQFLPNSRDLKNLFSDSYGIIALYGGFFALLKSKVWNGMKSFMGRVMIFFGLGLVLQAFGQFSYSVIYLLSNAEVPYPSLGDIGYFGSIPAYIVGVYYLSKAAGIQISLRSYKRKIQAFVIPVLMLTLSYLIFLRDYKFDWNSPLVIFLDFGYPLGQSIYVSIAMLTYLLSRDVLGGIMKPKILFILFALVVQYIADYMFLYKFKNEIWQTAGINEYFYLVAYFLMSLGIIQLETAFDSIKRST